VDSGISGSRLTITGHVFTRRCALVAGALLDFWQADSGGVYDNAGYRLRGHQFTDAMGAYSLQTIEPGQYPGRTAHIHVKVMAPGKPALTTQLYFPGETGNQQDSIFDAALLMDVHDSASGKTATFSFILDLP
jgi:protocatechuate 3,4-dioxygenase beta subunit